jgi:hypothetical protein
MRTLPDTPINSSVVVAVSGVLTVVGYFVKKSSDDRQHLVNATLETKKIDADMQANMLNVMKEMTTKTLV